MINSSIFFFKKCSASQIKTVTQLLSNMENTQLRSILPSTQMKKDIKNTEPEELRVEWCVCRDVIGGLFSQSFWWSLGALVLEVTLEVTGKRIRCCLLLVHLLNLVQQSRFHVIALFAFRRKLSCILSSPFRIKKIKRWNVYWALLSEALLDLRHLM